ncbi:MAG: hypothetical protein KDD53_01385 [Bdellovibrionales bacterium]|nr:hypothetical protein [Bdellovibrionales bacterium]
MLLFGGCTGESVPEGRILVKNTSQDRTYNVVKVSAGGRSYSLAPGQSALLAKGVSQITFSRRYEDHTKRYVVKCPREIGSGIVIKLIDVHTNRLRGNCETISAN